MTTEPIRALIVDDEPLARRTLRELLAGDPEVHVLGECDGVAAVERIASDRPDLLFLDVHMPGLDGFELLARVGVETVPAVVFVTAFDRHALRAFDVDAVDYLLKPFDDERFAAAMRRVKAALAPLRTAAAEDAASPVTGEAPGAAPRYLRRLILRGSERIALVKVEDVDWIEAADYYARLHVGGKSHLLRQSLAELEQALDPAAFFRLHRSAIVNLDRIRELVPHFRGEYSVVLKDGTTLRMTRGRLDELQRRLSR